MLSRLNQVLSGLLNRLATLLGIVLHFLVRILGPLLRALAGNWAPPAWMRGIGRAAAWVGGRLCEYALATMLVLGVLGIVAWQAPNIQARWRAWAPDFLNVGLVGDDKGSAVASFRVAPPGPRDVANDGPPQPLLVYFSVPTAQQQRIGHEAQDITISPEIAGTWTWSSATELAFQPKQDWPIGQQYKVRFGPKAFAPHVEIKERSFEFSAASFTVKAAWPSFYQDPTQPTVRRVVVTVDFTHPVDTQSFESHVDLEDGTQRKFSVSYDKFKLQATLQSEPLPIPAETKTMRIVIKAGVKAQRGGPGTSESLSGVIEIPGLYSLTINSVMASIISNDAGDPEHVLHVESSMGVHEREMARGVHAWMLPVSDKEGGEPFAWSDSEEVTDAVLRRSKPLKLEQLASEREVTETSAFRMPQAEGGRFVFVRIDKGLKTPGGYQLGATRMEIMQIKTFAPELSIMSQGSLLALSGEKKLPLLVRDLPGVSVDIARVLPQQLHLLASKASGAFSNPDFSRGITEDDLSEHFERKIPLSLRPGKTHFETVDFSEYLKGPNGERRGVFLLRVQGYDPKKADAGKPSQEVEESADYEGEGYDGEGSDGETVEPEQMRDQRLVIVTDLGLIAKKATDGSRDVFVQSITSGQPVRGAMIEVWGRNGLVLASATTDDGGRATLANLGGFTREKAPVLLVARKDGDLSFLPLGSAASLGRGERTLDMSRFDVGGLHTTGVPNQMSAYLFSDRGIYRPGDTIHVGIVAKAANWATQVKGMPVEVEVIDARGLSVRRETLFLGVGGTAEIAHATQDSSPTGNYTINLSLPRRASKGEPDVAPMLLGSTTVKVQEFMPDRMRVTAKMSKEVTEGWVSPTDLKLQVNVQNLFGTPAQHRRIDAAMTLSPAYPAFRSFPDFSFYDPTASWRSQTDELGSIESDEQGNAEFDLRLSRFQSATYRAHVLVKAFEPEGGRSVAAEAQTLVSDRPYLIGVKTVDSLSYVTRDARREFSLVAIDPQAKRTAVQGLKLVRVERRTVSVLVKQDNGLYRYQSRAKNITLDSQPFELPVAGVTRTINTSTPGNFALEVQDASGLVLNRIEYSVAGAANLTRSLDRNAELQIKLNRKDYQPGDEIELSIQAPYTGAGLITIERDKVYAHTWFKADNTASVQRITVPKDFEGTGYVTVQFVRDPASDEVYMSPLSYGAVPFATGLEKRTAKVRLTASEKVKPGETVKMHLSSDRPVRAFVFAIDEGILQVARYKTPDPLQFFFQKRALEVQTMQTLDLILPEFRKLLQGAAPGGDGEGEAGKHLNPFKRKRDKPVAWWSGLVDVDGAKDFTYTVPDSFNGALRVMAVVVNDDTVAAASTQALVRGDIVLLPTIPTSLAPGDTVDIGIGVANNIAGSGKGVPIKLGLAVNNGLEVVGEAMHTLSINERGEASTVFKVRAKSGAQAVLGSASVIFSATHAKASARLSTDLSVRPASALVTLVQSGTAMGAGELKSQLNAYPNFARSDLAVSATPWAFGSALMRYLDRYPYGCTEQITSRMIPGVVLADQPEMASKLAKDFDAKATFAHYIGQLRARQAANGGISAWPGTSPDDFATVYALQLLLEAKEHKLAVPADMVSKATTYLQSRLGSGDGSTYDWRTRTQMAYLLTRQGVRVPAALANLREQLSIDQRSAAGNKPQTDLGAAWLAASFQLLKQDAVARELMQPVWDDLVDRVRRKQARTSSDYYYDPLVHDSTLLYIAARHFPKHLQALPFETWDGLAKMIGQGWYNSQSSATTILAVDAYARAAAASGQGQLKASAVDATGKALALTLEGELRTMSRAAVPYGSKGVKLANGGPLPLFYGWSESGYERNLPETASYSGLEITHVILNDKGQAITEATIGDEVTVKVTVRALERDVVRQVALVDLLPSGLEPVLQPASGEEESDAPIWQRRLGGSGTWQLTYADIREDRVIFFGDVDRSAQEITYQARATNVGRFAMPAAYGEAMYERRIFGRSASGHFSVTPVKK